MSVKTDRELKEEASGLAKSLGFPLGTLINAFLRQFVLEKSVYFSAEPFNMSKFLEKKLSKTEKDIKKGSNLSPSFDKIEQAIKYLDENSK